MVDFHKEHLLHMIVVNDRLAEHLGVDKQAYLRAFILKDRATGETHALLRFNQPDGKSWSEIRGHTPERLLDGIKLTFTLATRMVAPDLEEPVKVYTPPRPDLSPDDTVAWLLDQDLIEINFVEPGMKITGSPDGAL